jgi:hypothetical protein
MKTPPKLKIRTARGAVKERVRKSHRNHMAENIWIMDIPGLKNARIHPWHVICVLVKISPFLKERFYE